MSAAGDPVPRAESSFAGLLQEAVEVLAFKSGSVVPIAGYFGTLFAAAAGCVLTVFPWARACGAASAPRGALLGGAAAFAFAAAAWVLTWTPILRFIVAHHAEHAGIDYAAMPSFFVTAYEDVTRHPTGWFWSQQLLMWVLPACTFMPVHARRVGLPRLAPLIVIAAGFLGAISLAFPFFFVAVWIRGNGGGGGGGGAGGDGVARPLGARARLLVLATTLVATSNVLALPATQGVSTEAYVFHLACLHAILVVPTLAVVLDGRWDGGGGHSDNSGSDGGGGGPTAGPPRRASCVPSLRSIFLLQAALCLLSHALAVRTALYGDAGSGGDPGGGVDLADDGAEVEAPALRDLFLQGPFHNLCQTSIFLDVVLATLVAAPLFIAATVGRGAGGAYATWMLLASPGCAYAVYCAQSQSAGALPACASAVGGPHRSGGKAAKLE